jgi:anthranilate phosphoribosyltransferase
MIRQVLSGRPGTARDIVVLNAAAAIWLAGAANEERSAAGLAAQAIDSGAAADKLQRLAAMSQQVKRQSPGTN